MCIIYAKPPWQPDASLLTSRKHSRMFGARVGFGQCIAENSGDHSVSSRDGRQEIRLNEALERVVGQLYCYEDELLSLLHSAGAYVKIGGPHTESEQSLSPPAPEMVQAQGQEQTPPQDNWQKSPASWLNQFVKSRFSPTTITNDLKSLHGAKDQQSLMYLCFSYSDPTESLPEEVAILLDEAGVRM